MLLSLLPLAGWATTYDVTVTPQPKSSVYGAAFAIDETWFTINVGDPGTLKSGIKELIQVNGVEPTATVGGHAYTFAFNSATTSVGIGADTYNLFLSEATATLTITQADNNNFTTGVAMTGWTYGNAANDPTSSPKWGTATYQYKVSTAGDETYTEIKPSNAGTYTVKATVAATNEWSNVATSTANFTIAKGDNAWTTEVAMDGWTYGETAANPTSTPKWGTATYQYKVSTAGDDTYTDSKPSDAGTYTVKATVAVSGNWNAAITSTANFTIAKAAAGLVADNIQINGAAVAASYEYSDALALAVSYNGTPATTAVPYFRFSSDGGTNWVENPVLAKGDNWLVGCGAMPTTNYNAAWVNKSFTITAGDQVWATPLSANDVTFGNALDVTAAVAKYENAIVTHYYKLTSADDETYTTTAPTNVGNYTVKAVAASTTNYAELSATATFNINSADATVATAPTAKTGLTYDGTAQPLVNAGTATNGTMQYKIGDGEWSDVVPTATDAGSYTISYQVKGNANYNDDANDAYQVNVTIEKISLNYALGNQTSEYTGEEILPNGNYAKMAGNFAAGENLSTVATFSFGDEPTDVADSKTYNALEVNWLNNSDKNYNITFTGSSILTITPKAFDEAMISSFAASTTWDNSVKTPGYTVADGDPSALDADDYDVVITKAGAEVAASEVKAAGEYTYTFTPKNNYAGDAIAKVFTINGKALLESMLKTPATWSATANYNGTDRKPATIVLKDGTTTLTGSDYEMVITNTKDENEDGKNDVVTAAINADTYTFTFTGKGNYTGNFTKTLTVNKAAATVTAPTAVAGLKYTSDAQTLINAGSANGGTIKYCLAEAGEYTTALPEGTDAGDYTVWYKVEADDNHSDVAPASIDVTIDPALVLVSVKENISKDYDGTTAFGTQKPSLEFSGLKGADTKDVITFDDTEVAAISAKDVEAAPGEYDLEVDLDQLHATNYTFAANAEITRTFTINATGLVIIFNNNTVDEEITAPYKKVYGTDDAFNTAAWKTANLAVGGAISDDDADAIIAGVNVTRVEGEDVGTYQMSIEVTDADVFSNYAANPSTGNATFEITKATLQVALKNDLGKAYDNAAPAATFQPEAAALAISGYKNGDAISAITTLPTATIVGASKNQGTYTITLDGAVAANYDFEYTDARYVITPIALTAVTVAEQSVNIGADDEDLNTTEGVAYTIEGVLEGETDDLGVALAINGSTAAAATLNDGIALTISNTNYTLPENAAAIYGVLKVVNEAATIVLTPYNKAAYQADNTIGNAQEAALEAADGEVRTITFGDFTMTAGHWYTMVLPFETSVMELSQKFGYAVVETMQNATAGSVKFGIVGGTINPNVPFLIQIFGGNKNLNTVSFEKTIEYSANPVATDNNGSRLVGTYKGSLGYDAPFVKNQQWYMAISDGVWYSSETGYTRPTGAYLDIKTAGSQAPVIYIEDPQNGTTGIMTIGADDASANAEGWYNVNGMKRNNAPAQKGVYIKNGKKVILK